MAARGHLHHVGRLGGFTITLSPSGSTNGYGVRVPGLDQPVSRPGFIDRQTLSFDAYLELVEDRFLGGQRLDPLTDGGRTRADRQGGLARSWAISPGVRFRVVAGTAAGPGPDPVIAPADERERITSGRACDRLAPRHDPCPSSRLCASRPSLRSRARSTRRAWRAGATSHRRRSVVNAPAPAPVPSSDPPMIPTSASTTSPTSSWSCKKPLVRSLLRHVPRRGRIPAGRTGPHRCVRPRPPAGVLSTALTTRTVRRGRPPRTAGLGDRRRRRRGWTGSSGRWSRSATDPAPPRRIPVPGSQAGYGRPARLMGYLAAQRVPNYWAYANTSCCRTTCRAGVVVNASLPPVPRVAWAATCPDLSDPMSCRSDLKFPGSNAADHGRDMWIPRMGRLAPTSGPTSPGSCTAADQSGVLRGSATCPHPGVVLRRIQRTPRRSRARLPGLRDDQNQSPAPRTSSRTQDYFEATRTNTSRRVVGHADHGQGRASAGRYRQRSGVGERVVNTAMRGPGRLHTAILSRGTTPRVLPPRRAAEGGRQALRVACRR